MYKEHRILAIIPARGGSKGLPGKNIAPLAGKPLIAWTIQEAAKSRYLDRCIISSESKKILSVARASLGDCPFVRPKEYARDSSPMIECVSHAISWTKKNDIPYDVILVLQPTSPLRTVADIDGAIESFFAKGYKSLVSVCEAEHNPLWSNTLPGDLSMRSFLPEKIRHKQRQALPVYYRLNGALYLAYTDYLVKHKSFFTRDAFAYCMPTERSIDVDSALDLEIAAYLLTKRAEKSRVQR
jgi:CMP-N,N'-diacetyllegionaminic acid synthase